MTKAEIRTNFLRILNNTECTDALADTFIAEGVSRSQRLLKLTSQETLESTTVGGSFTALDVPSDALRIIAVYHEQFKLKRVGLAYYLENSYGAGSSNAPKMWTRNRDDILVTPTPAEGVVLNILYYGEFEAFANDDDDTPLSIAAPDLYIYGGLCYAADHFVDERLKRFEERYQQIIAELQSQDDEDELSGGAIIEVPAEYAFPAEDY